MNRKLFFRADASVQIGYGHFVRTLALAEMLNDCYDCSFFISSPTEDQVQQIKKVCKCVCLKEETKFEGFLAYLTGTEIVILDNYFFSSDYQQQIKNKGCKLVTFGTNDRHYYCDVLINYAESNPLIFDVEPYTEIKLGIDWVILRKEFRNIHHKHRSKTHRIAICYGGTDQYHLTEKTIEVIKAFTHPYAIDVIASDRFGNERIKTLQQDGVCCHVNASAGEIVNVFDSCDYLISSSSTITHEGIACGLPVLCGYYVDNQRRMYDYFVNEHLVIGLSDLLSDSFSVELESALMNIDKYQASIRSYVYGDVQNRYLNLFNAL